MTNHCGTPGKEENLSTVSGGGRRHCQQTPRSSQLSRIPSDSGNLRKDQQSWGWRLGALIPSLLTGSAISPPAPTIVDTPNNRLSLFVRLVMASGDAAGNVKSICPRASDLSALALARCATRTQPADFNHRAAHLEFHAGDFLAEPADRDPRHSRTALPPNSPNIARMRGHRAGLART